MRIRNKLLLASAIPITLLIVQIVTVNVFIRELQSAVQFIGTAQNTIEADFLATDLVEKLREKIKTLPSHYSQPNDNLSNYEELWQQLGQQINLIESSSATKSVDQNTLAALQEAYSQAEYEISTTRASIHDSSTDLDTLLERAIFTNKSLSSLNRALETLALQLRQQLQLAVDRERRIHNRPVIAGAVIGSLAVALSLILGWLFWDRSIARRLTALSDSMLAIAGGNLRAKLPTESSADEISEMGQALAIFRDTAIEVEESNLREIAQTRQQRLYWLENMASFLRHELKNKQIGAEQSINLLVSREGQNPQVIKYCERASRSLSEMKELINSTVDAADIESALLSEESIELDLHDFLRNYIDSTVQTSGTDVVYLNKLLDRPVIYGDQHRLEQMLDKIISNALDFKTANTDIVISTTTQGETNVVINIENQGPSLPEDPQSLFELSVTARDQEKKQPGNVGFGLFVARRIAEFHDGTISASNSDSGPVFSVRLPVHSYH